MRNKESKIYKFTTPKSFNQNFNQKFNLSKTSSLVKLQEMFAQKNLNMVL